jgi:hypothetical protein
VGKKIIEVARRQKTSKTIWWSLFTPLETLHIVEEQEKGLLMDVLSRLSTVMEQWQTRPGYPATPTSRMEIELARIEGQRARRTAHFEYILQEQSHETDDWITSVFEASSRR